MAHETLQAELYFERGGPADWFLQRLSLAQRIILLSAIAWLPLLILSLLQGRALGATPRESLLLDFATYARFFVAMPALLLAQATVGPRLRKAGLQFVDAKLVRPGDYPVFERAIEQVRKWREAALPEVIIVIIALVSAWTITVETWYGPGPASWHAGHSPVALWNRVVAIPLLEFLLLRWLWRLIIWTRFLLAMSKLNLDLVATHADAAGGLGFLGRAHGALGIFAFAFSSVVSADVAFRMIFDGTKIQTFELPLAALVIAYELIFLSPLLLFMPMLMKTGREWSRRYSILLDEYNRAFDQKWVAGKRPSEERLLGSADIQSLADLANSYDRIKGMKLVPFGKQVVIRLAAAAALPALPLLLLVVPVADIVKALMKAVF